LDKTPLKKSARTTIVDQIKEESKQPAETLTPRVEFLTTGSTLLNLALSQKGKDGGVARGRIINIVGDGGSGKTLLVLEILAHAFYGMENDD
jgi:RecA/RadA recombinase